MRIAHRMTSIALGFGMALALSVPAAADAPTAAAAPAAKAKFSTSSSQLSTLMADPAAKAVLVKHVPQLVEKDDILDQAGGMTLKELSSALGTYAPDLLSTKVLAEIDADLAQIK